VNPEAQAIVFHFEFTLTPEDFIEGQRAFCSSLGSRWARFNYKALVPLGVIFIAEGVAAYFLHLDWIAVFVLPVIGAYCILKRLFLWPWRLRRQYLRYPEASAPRTVEFNEGGIQAQSSHARGEIIWSRFGRFTETPSLFILFAPPSILYTVPKRAVPADRMDELRRFLSSKLAQPTSTK
jgi:hypothetical protein